MVRAQALEAVDADGWSALHFACVSGHTEVSRVCVAMMR